MERPFNEIFEIPTLNGDNKSFAKLNTTSKEGETKPRKEAATGESGNIDSKKSTSQTLADTAVSNIKTGIRVSSFAVRDTGVLQVTYQTRFSVS